MTFPTDPKLLNKIIGYSRKVAGESGVKLRQSYVRTVKGLKLIQRFLGRPHSGQKVAKADRKMRTIAGRIVRELLRVLPAESGFRPRLDLCLKFVNGEKVDGHKIYSLHEPGVLCISKGKEHKKYEFGDKVSVVRLWNGIIIGTLSFRNEYDGRTIVRAMEQVGRVYGRRLRILAGDRGYRGRETSGDTQVVIPDVPKASDTAYAREKKHKLFRKRAGHRALQERPPAGTQLLQGLLRRLHQRHARCCGFQLQEGHEPSFAPVCILARLRLEARAKRHDFTLALLCVRNANL